MYYVIMELLPSKMGLKVTDWTELEKETYLETFI